MNLESPVRLNTPPALLAWRTFRGPQDYPVLAAIGQRADLAEHVEQVLTLDDVVDELEHPVNCNPREDLLIAEIDGRPVAWQQTYWQLQDGQYHYKLRGYVSPGWRRRGIGRALLRQGERRLRQVAAGHPAEDARFLGTFCSARRAGKAALFAAEGYQPIRHFYTMLRTGLDSLPDAPLPAGLELRPVRPTDWRVIWDANEEAFRDHWGYSEKTDQDFERQFAQPGLDTSLWQVAWNTANNQVAGVAINSIPSVASAANAAGHPPRGTVVNLSVRRPWRRHGLGRALLVASLFALRQRGQIEVKLGVDSENLTGALRLYESVGFRPIEHGMILTKVLENQS